MGKRRRQRHRPQGQPADQKEVVRERDESYAETQARRLEEMAVRRRWAVPAEIKDAVVSRMGKIVIETPNDLKAIKASRVLLAADALDQKDDHAELNRKNGNDNIEELDNAIKSELAHMAGGEEAIAAAPPAPAEQPERVQPPSPLAETKDVP